MDLDTFSAAIPQQLKDLKRWIGWAPSPKGGQPKCPVLLHNKTVMASTRKPTTWGTFAVAQHFWAKYGQPKADGTPSDMGVGFVFADGDGLIYLDLDDAVENGQLREWAVPFVSPFFGKAYIELSPSGRGIHVIARGTLPVDACGGKVNLPQHASDWAKTKKRCPEVAIFATGKYTTISGDVIDAGRGFGPDVTAEVLQVWTAAGIKAHGTDRVAGPPPDPDRLGKIEMKRVPKEVREELKTCEAGAAADRSAARFGVYAQMAQKGLEAEEILAVILFHEDWYVASGASEKGYEHTWQDIVRACAKTESAKAEFDKATREREANTEQTFVNWKTLGLPTVARDTRDGPVHEVVHGVQAMVCVLNNHPAWKGRFRLNSMSMQIEHDGKPLGETLSPIAESIRQACGWDREPDLRLVFQAIQEAAEANAYNPIQLYLQGLAWDGVPRLDDWLVRAGCEDEEATRLIGRKWLISLVARALTPGCKADNVLILEGPQGAKKSTLFAALAGHAYFTDSPTGLDRDGLMTMHGHWIVELAELAAVKKAETVAIKRFLSTQYDNFRAPYARANRVYPRSFVVVGSTNEDDYLQDTTGNRRFWPVRVTGLLDPAWVAATRDQLLAEAVVAFQAGEPWWWDTQPEALERGQQDRVQADPLEGLVVAWIEANPGMAFGMSALLQALGLPVDRVDLSRRIGVVLREQGYIRTLQRRPGAPRQRIWRKPEDGPLAPVIPLHTDGSPEITLDHEGEIDPTS